MIQRVQSVYLFLAAVFALLAFVFPVFSFESDITEVLNAKSDMALMILVVVTAILALFGISQFKNRSFQQKISLGVGLVSMATIAYLAFKYWSISTTDLQVSPGIGGLGLLLVPIFCLLAYSAIGKDEKLVKSLDRLR